MKTACIVVIRNNEIVEARKLLQRHSQKKSIQEVFLETAREALANFDEYTPEDIDACLEAKEFKMVNGSVSLVEFYEIEEEQTVYQRIRELESPMKMPKYTGYRKSDSHSATQAG